MTGAPAPDRRSRREVLRLAAAGAAALCAPGVLAQRSAGTRLRVLGTPSTLQEPVRRRAEQELGLSIQFIPMSGATALQRALRRPESFDIVDLWASHAGMLWQSGSVRSIELSRITNWEQVSGRVKLVESTGDAGFSVEPSLRRWLYEQENGKLGAVPTGRVSCVPYVLGLDSYVYDAGVLRGGTPYEDESWGSLLDRAHSGRVALFNDPMAGFFDAALAARARGLVTISDVSAMTRGEVDALFDVLLEYSADGHFAGFWNTVTDAVRYMQRDGVAVQSMGSLGALTLRGAGVQAVSSAPREGYRAWHGALFLSAGADEPARRAAHAFINWQLSGWPGAFSVRQGRYASAPALAQGYLSRGEWEYWCEGLPATRRVVGADGREVATPGERRRGGSHRERMSRIAVWNGVTDAYEHVLGRWVELLQR